jgi:CHASE2 domain-containing sensor protein
MAPRRVTFAARYFGAFVAASVFGLLMAGSFELAKLSQIDFLRAVARFDAVISHLLTPPRFTPDPLFKKVVLMDIDGGTLARFGLVEHSELRTPRSLLANVLQRIRDGGPAAILLDIDISQPSADDVPLMNELTLPDRSPVIVARTLYGTATSLPHCSKQTDSSQTGSVRLPPAAFAGLPVSAPVFNGHSVFEPGWSGFIEGICSHYVLTSDRHAGQGRIDAAAVLAVEFAQRRSSVLDDDAQRTLETPRLFLLQFHVGTSYRGDTSPFYSHVSAGNVFFEGADAASLKDRIVVIGASHRGSVDLHETPVGTMTGALVHANAIIQLQSQHELVADEAAQFSAKIILVVLLAAAFAFFQISITGVPPRNAFLVFVLFSRLGRILLYFAAVVVICIFYYGVVLKLFFQSQQFSIVIPIVAVCIEVVVELFSLISHSVAELLTLFLTKARTRRKRELR